MLGVCILLGQRGLQIPSWEMSGIRRIRRERRFVIALDRLVDLKAFGVEVDTACRVGKRLEGDVVGGGGDWSYVVIIF